MSKNKLIALAIAAVLASPAAYAVDVELNPVDGDVLPTNAITDEDQDITVGSEITIAAGASDSYLGRNTGYNIRVSLDDGATFATAVDVADVAGTDALDVVTIAGGGGVGDTSVTFSVEPNEGVVEGDGIVIAADAFVVENAEFLADGEGLTIDVRVGDPVGGGELASLNDTEIATAIEGWDVTVDAGANTAIRIDVGSDSGKKLFSSDGEINTADTPYFNAGEVTALIDADLTAAMGLDEAVATVSIVLTGEDFSAFTEGEGTDGFVYLSDADDCLFQGPLFEVNTAGTTATLEDGVTVDDLQVTPFVCLEANTEVVIADQDLSAAVVISQTGMEDSAEFEGDLTSLAYNGSVTEVMFFNPASNVDQQSYLRISNTSGTSGLFTIDGVCDDGTATDPVSFTLAAGNSKLLTSQDVENGNATKGLTGATGSCTASGSTGVTAKQRLTITGEVGGMEVQNFLRNGTSAGSINTNVNNDDN